MKEKLLVVCVLSRKGPEADNIQKTAYVSYQKLFLSITILSILLIIHPILDGNKPYSAKIISIESGGVNSA